MAKYIDIEGAGIGKANREQFLVPEFADGWNAVLKILEKEPTADVVEVKHGEWKHECLECSVCKRNISEICDADSYLTSGIEDELLFCPFCGAKMDGRSDT